jgi:hypothetical protein
MREKPQEIANTSACTAEPADAAERPELTGKELSQVAGGINPAILVSQGPRDPEWTEWGLTFHKITVTYTDGSKTFSDSWNH